MTPINNNQMSEEAMKLNKVEDFKQVIRLEQNKDGQWYVAFKNGAIGKIDFISLLLTLISHERAEAVEDFWNWCMEHASYEANGDKHILCSRKLFEEYAKLAQLKKEVGDETNNKNI